MAVETATDAAASFQIGASDVGPIFVDRLHVPCSPYSPFADGVGQYQAGSRTGSDGIPPVISHPTFQAAAAIVASPDFRMFHRTGGGAVPVSVFGAYRNRSVSADALVAVSPSFEGSYLVQYFPTREGYLDWWVETIAGKVEESSPNYLPPPLTVESLVYALHAIDCFRRASFQSMLEYAPTENPFVTARDFQDTIARSITSNDLRWLLPSFLSLTPGLVEHGFDRSAEHLSVLADQDLLIPASHEKTGEPIYLFGEAGRAMGVEFHRTWLFCVGFDTALVTPSGDQVLHRGFLAPTALANHLVRLEPAAGGGLTANHQALTAAELRSRLEAMLEADMAAQPSPAPEAGSAAGKRAPAVASAGARVCPSCGAAIGPAARFCPSCGAAAQPSAARGEEASCHNCGARMKAGAGFCPECGTAATP